MEIPSYGEMAQILTAIAALGGFLISIKNARNIETVHRATNSMKDQLVAEVRSASFARGVKQGEENPQ